MKYENYLTREHREDFLRPDTESEDEETPAKNERRSQEGASSSNAGRPKSNCSTVDSQDPDQRAAIHDEYDQLLNQTHNSLGEIAAAAPGCVSDNFVSQHARPQTGHLITCQKCGTESENGSTICGHCFRFIVYKFDGGQPQSLKVAFFSAERGVEQVELRVITGKLSGHRAPRKNECDRLDQHYRKAKEATTHLWRECNTTLTSTRAIPKSSLQGGTTPSCIITTSMTTWAVISTHTRGTITRIHMYS